MTRARPGRTGSATVVGALLILFAFFASVGTASAQDTPRQGGILKAAMIGEPPTLDEDVGRIKWVAR